MSWRRAALDERLEILKEQLREQLSMENGGLLDWLEHQIKELMTVAACSAHDDYVSRKRNACGQRSAFRWTAPARDRNAANHTERPCRGLSPHPVRDSG